jgi:hypothetical protein
VQRDAHHFMQLRGGRHFLIAVEDHGEGRLQTRVQDLEVAAREERQPRLGVGREQRQRLALHRGGQAEVMEERGDVGIAVVDLVPQVINAGMLEPARGKRGLARARRPRQPRHRAAAFLQQIEQALARKYPGEARPGGFAERSALGLHRGALPETPQPF